VQQLLKHFQEDRILMRGKSAGVCLVRASESIARGPSCAKPEKIYFGYIAGLLGINNINAEESTVSHMVNK
jgi:hypothetical protein